MKVYTWNMNFESILGGIVLAVIFYTIAQLLKTPEEKLKIEKEKEFKQLQIAKSDDLAFKETSSVRNIEISYEGAAGGALYFFFLSILPAFFLLPLIFGLNGDVVFVVVGVFSSGIFLLSYFSAVKKINWESLKYLLLASFLGPFFCFILIILYILGYT